MYYWDSENPYKNPGIIHHIKKTLPMDEFAKGNFSQAFKIVDTYRAYIKECIEERMNGYTKSKGISTYLEEELIDLEAQHKEWTEKKGKAIQEIAKIQEQIKERKQALKDEWNGDTFRNTFFTYLEKVNPKKHVFDLIALGFLETAFERAEWEYPDKYKASQDTFNKFILSARRHIEETEELEVKLSAALQTRQDATYKLSHKSNRSNLEKEIDKIKTGKEATRIGSLIRKDIFKLFKKIDHTDRENDERDLKEMFVSIIATELITDCKTDKKTKISLIKNHTDKVGLFWHIRNIYQNNSQIFVEIDTGRRDNKVKDKNELLKDKIESIADTSREILQNIPAISFYFWVDKNAPEQIKKRESISRDERKNYVIEDLISHLKDVLQTPQKKSNWSEQSDKKIRKLFEGIYTITESHEFEKYCEKVWNIDQNSYRDIIWIEWKMLLSRIYVSMNQEERENIKAQYNHRDFFLQIEKDINTKEKIQQKKQLLLFDLAPMINYEWYIDQVNKHIESLLGNISYDNKRLFGQIIKEMLGAQWHKQHIDTSKEIISLPEDEFIEKVKKNKRGKALSDRIKKIKGNIFPNIHERIKKMEKIESEK